MAMPRSVTRVRRDGLEFISNVDRVKYTLNELTRAALRDTAKLIRHRLIQKLKKLRGMRRSRRLYVSTQYWVRRRDADLQIGFKHDTWYGKQGERGERRQPQRNLLRQTVYENIADIQRVQSQYLSRLSQENPNLSDTSEDEYKSPKKAE